MTDTQFLTIVGTIWIAPYVNKWFAQFAGVVYLAISIFSYFKSLGWL
jgi:hypothetical protein